MKIALKYTFYKSILVLKSNNIIFYMQINKNVCELCSFSFFLSMVSVHAGVSKGTSVNRL